MRAAAATAYFPCFSAAASFYRCTIVLYVLLCFFLSFDSSCIYNSILYFLLPAALLRVRFPAIV